MYLRIWSILEKGPQRAEKKVYIFFCVWVKCSVNICWAQLVLTSISFSISLFSILCVGGGWQSTCKSMVLKLFTISMWGLICDLSCGHASFTNLDVLLFGAQMLRIEMSSWSLLVRTRGKEPGPGPPSPKRKNSQN